MELELDIDDLLIILKEVSQKHLTVKIQSSIFIHGKVFAEVEVIDNKAVIKYVKES